MQTPKRPRTIAFDFDGVIASYSGWKGHQHTGTPHREVVKAIRLLKKQGHRILIYSTRPNATLRAYCVKYRIPVDYFNENPAYRHVGNSGKPVAFAYIDDRAICYKGQTAETLLRQLKRFKPHWK